jgi:hypothetical protein
MAAAAERDVGPLAIDALVGEHQRVIDGHALRDVGG